MLSPKSDRFNYQLPDSWPKNNILDIQDQTKHPRVKETMKKLHLTINTLVIFIIVSSNFIDMYKTLGLWIREIYNWNPYNANKPNFNISTDIGPFAVKLYNTTERLNKFYVSRSG